MDNLRADLGRDLNILAPLEFLDMLQKAGVSDKKVLQIMLSIDRANFIEGVFKRRAWDDQTLPIGNGQTISLPSMVGKMTQQLELNAKDRVLEIGTGCGYQTSILSYLCKKVYSVERHFALGKFATDMFKKQRIYNIYSTVNDGFEGIKAQAPFDKIIVTCSAMDIPPKLLEQLKIGGIMIVPIGERGAVQNLLKITKSAQGINVSKLENTLFVPMLEGIG